MEATEYVEHTKKWVEQVVIGWNFCPFAKRPYYDGRIRFIVLHIESVDDLLANMVTECELLNSDASIETTLVIIAGGLMDFSNYLDCLELVEVTLSHAGYDGVYQVASFHPHYLFEGSDESDPANYTNRSPYPMFHLLREEGLSDAIDSFEGEVEQIPSENIRHAHILGLKKLKSMLEQSRA